MGRNSPYKERPKPARAVPAVGGAAAVAAAIAPARARQPEQTGDLTPAARAIFEGVGKAIVGMFETGDFAEVLAAALAPPTERSQPLTHNQEAPVHWIDEFPVALAVPRQRTADRATTPTSAVQQELRDLKKEVEMLRERVGQLEAAKGPSTSERLDSFMELTCGKDWRTLVTPMSEKRALNVLGKFTDEEWERMWSRV